MKQRLRGSTSSRTTKGHICVSARLLDHDAKSERLQTTPLHFDRLSSSSASTRVERRRSQDAHELHGARWDLRTAKLQTTSSFKQMEERVDIVDWVFKCQDVRGRPTENVVKLFSTMRHSGDRGASSLNWSTTGVRVVVRTGLLRSILDELGLGTHAP